MDRHKDIMLRKVCWNCIHSANKSVYTLICELHPDVEVIPLYGNCPYWEGRSARLQTKYIKKFQLER